MRVRISALAVLAGALSLTACGGGGGGSTGQAPQQPQFSRATAASTNSATVQNAGKSAAGNLPRFGSVTQSSNAGAVAGITGDATSVSFDGRNARVTIRRTDGSRLSFNGATDRFDSVSYAPIIPGYSFRGDAMLKETATSVSLAAVYTNWNNSNPNDFLAGGYWMHVTGRVSPPVITGAEIGAFVDGPELRGPSTQPVTGTASYSGQTGGFYAYRSAQGVEIGEYGGLASFTADFGANTISGCIGCNGGVDVSGVAADTSGRTYEFEDVNVPVRLRLAAASIQNDGTFRNRRVSLERDDATVTSTSGSWGGRFSTIQTAANDPRLVAGTAGATWTEATGAEGVFAGAWYAVKR